MNMISTTGMRRCDALVDTLKAEFGGVLAGRILEAEAVDFLWDGRIAERYLGEHISIGIGDEDASQELSRVAILSFLDDRWHAGTCIVNGEGAAVELVWRRQFESREEAEIAFERAC